MTNLKCLKCSVIKLKTSTFVEHGDKSLLSGKYDFNVTIL